jgi:hypothetical protein
MQEKNQEAINNFAAFQGAIPGQSLTNDPDQKYPWEQPPRITNQQEALDYMTSEILEEENLFPIMRAVSKGVPRRYSFSYVTTSLSSWFNQPRFNVTSFRAFTFCFNGYRRKIRSWLCFV